MSERVDAISEMKVLYAGSMSKSREITPEFNDPGMFGMRSISRRRFDPAHPHRAAEDMPRSAKQQVQPLPLRGDRPTVTVVIPCYNYARYLPQAVASALSQSGVAMDVVIVDDASTDDSLAVARRMSEENGRVRVIGHSTNKGPVQTFNDGLALATGEFLVRLDADDLLTAGSLVRSAAVMRHYSVRRSCLRTPVAFFRGGSSSGENYGHEMDSLAGEGVAPRTMLGCLQCDHVARSADAEVGGGPCRWPAGSRPHA